MDNKRPELGDILKAAHPSEETLNLLRLRRSATAAQLGEPGPSEEQLSRILEIGARVPDHRRVYPFRFLVFEGEARAKFGEKLGEVFKTENLAADETATYIERTRFLRAPVVVAVIFSPQTEHKTPVWEQQLTTGAACQNLLIAANASGFASQWLTEWYAFNDRVLRHLGLAPHEKVAGFIYIGTAKEDPKERPRQDPATLIGRWQG